MAISTEWDQLTEAEWCDFAKSWLEEIRGGSDPSDDDIGQSVVLMNFTAEPEHQWQFIRAAVTNAQSDDELGKIAAGPMEHLLGHHGDKFVAEIESLAEHDAKFARTLTGVWKYTMTDDVWERIRVIQSRVQNPLFFDG